MSIAEKQELTCPGCGAVGYINWSEQEPKIFEPRGQLEGQSVLRCSACGGGLFASMGRGWVSGQPERIDDDMWREMCAEWDEHHPTRS